MKRRTIIVDGPLAFRMRRIVAARAGEIGAEILTLPLLAARLNGGFARPAASEDIEQAVRGALDQGGFAVLEPGRDLPGMVRALSASLQGLWREGRLAEGLEARDAKATDVALVEERVRTVLPRGML
ncbi:MAG: PD-(D/E)XK nuclease family protein, partial [Vitreimonas sp.]